MASDLFLFDTALVGKHDSHARSRKANSRRRCANVAKTNSIFVKTFSARKDVISRPRRHFRAAVSPAPILWIFVRPVTASAADQR
jgi:hypothetical protein